MAATDASLHHVSGLSLVNEQLLEQKGAVGELSIRLAEESKRSVETSALEQQEDL